MNPLPEPFFEMQLGTQSACNRGKMGAWFYLMLIGAFSANCEFVDLPKFSEPIINVTAAVGREAILVCIVDDLSAYKVAWLRVDTQTILTIHSHVITKNHRIGVSHSDHRTWYLHIKEVRESDRGWYMCQINTDPMKSQVGFLDVVVPPDILDYPTSSDMAVREGYNASLRCAASGSPAPNITWKRENGELIPLGNNVEVISVDGPLLNISRVNRIHMGPYLCIASNGVPPSVSKRIMLIVNFPPMIWIQNQLIGAYEGQKLSLECHSEAHPKSITYWAKETGEIIAQSPRHEPVVAGNSYKIHMKLLIKSVTQSDYGSYKCVSRNSLGEADGTIKIYPIENMDKQRGSTKLKAKYKSRNYSARRTAQNGTSTNASSTDYEDVNWDDEIENGCSALNVPSVILITYSIIALVFEKLVNY